LALEKREHGFLADIVNPEFVPAVEQLARHWLTHVAEAKAADAHRVTPVKGAEHGRKEPVLDLRFAQVVATYLPGSL
jgi:hypothetical protein